MGHALAPTNRDLWPAASRRTLLTRTMLLLSLTGIILGFLLRGLVPKVTVSSWTCELGTGAMLLLMWVTTRLASRRIRRLDGAWPSAPPPRVKVATGDKPRVAAIVQRRSSGEPHPQVRLASGPGRLRR